MQSVMPLNSQAFMAFACISRLACVYVLVESVTPAFVGEKCPDSSYGRHGQHGLIGERAKGSLPGPGRKGRDSLRFIHV